MVNIKLPNGAMEILNQIRSHNHIAYVVGGCIRDSLLGREPKDWDICTSATPDQIKEFLSSYKNLDTGLQHGTITVIAEDGSYEVTTFRVDGRYSDGRHPDTVEFVLSLYDDLSRRDFTINAMAFNPSVGLIDYFGGEKDLRDRVLSCVGKPHERFQEDALRILRALRFSSVYGFCIEDTTSQAIHAHSNLLKNIAAERINSELCELLLGDSASSVLLEYSDVISKIIPQLSPCIGFDQNNRFHQYTVYEHIVRAVENYPGQDLVTKLTLLLHDIGKPRCYTEDEKGGHFRGHGVVSRDIAEQILTDLRFDNKTKQQVTELVLYHDSTIAPTEKAVKRWLNKIGEEQFLRLLDVKMADIFAHRRETQEDRISEVQKVRILTTKVLEEKQCFSIKDLAINGCDLIDLGIQEGPRIGELLAGALGEVIEGTLENVSEVLLDWISELTDGL